MEWLAFGVLVAFDEGACIDPWPAATQVKVGGVGLGRSDVPDLPRFCSTRKPHEE